MSFRASRSPSRQPYIGKPRNFEPDGKIHAVLDTNVPLYAMWALHKATAATEVEYASLKILRAVEESRVVVGVTERLFDEYLRKAHDHMTKADLGQQSIEAILNIIKKDRVDFRVLVSHAGFIPKDPSDEVLFNFNGLRGEYLISNDQHVLHKMWSDQNPYGEIIKPIRFVKDVLKG